MHGALGNFLDRLQETGSEFEAGRLLLDFFKANGADGGNIWFATGVTEDRPVNSAATDYPTGWIELVYQSKILQQYTLPRIVARSYSPVRWGFDMDKRRYSTESMDYRLSRIALGDFGLRNVLVYPVPTHDRRGTSGVSFFTRGDETEFGVLCRSKGAEFGHAAHLAHLHMQRLRRNAPEIVVLTARERESLLWLSIGLRVKEIADRMGVREVTVNLHLTNARKRLKAKTREEALAKAILFNLIRP